MPLHFDLDGWRPAAFRGDAVTIYLKGKFRTTAGQTIDAPLLVKFPIGKGTVLFTSFHNEKQNSELETKLLRHLVFSTVTAGVEATVTRSMVSGGFSLQKTSLLSAAPGDPSVTRTYPHAKPGALAFTLGFEPRGATLRLEVVSPVGERFVKQGDSTVTIDVPKAVAGTWTYTATPEVLPYPNYPFTLSVGTAGRTAAVAATPSPPSRTAKPAATGRVRFRDVLTGQVAQAGPQRIAVSKPQFDDMGKLLGTLGDGYRFETIRNEDLLRPQSLDKFDILFLTCSTLPGEWFVSLGGDSGREGIGTGTVRKEVLENFGETLRRFVNRGGTLYASDWCNAELLWAFPDRQANLDLDLGPLRELDEAERDWLKLKVPLAKAGTISETLKGVDLSPAMKEQLDRVIAVVELFDPGPGPDRPDRSRPLGDPSGIVPAGEAPRDRGRHSGHRQGPRRVGEGDSRRVSSPAPSQGRRDLRDSSARPNARSRCSAIGSTKRCKARENKWSPRGSSIRV